jgi:hypothetical protein
MVGMAFLVHIHNSFGCVILVVLLICCFKRLLPGNTLIAQATLNRAARLWRQDYSELGWRKDLRERREDEFLFGAASKLGANPTST